MWSRSSRFCRGLRALPPDADATELSRTSRAGVINERGSGGGFILVSDVGVFIEVGVWLFVWMAGDRTFWLFGVEGGRIGAGCRLLLMFVGAIGTSLNVWKADGIDSCRVPMGVG